MKRIITVIITGLLLLILGIASGYGLRAATEPIPSLHVTTQQVHVTPQEIQPGKLYCHVAATLVDPNAVYKFSQDITCQSMLFEAIPFAFPTHIIFRDSPESALDGSLR